MFGNLWRHKFLYAFLFIGFFFVSYFALYLAGLIPEEFKDVPASTEPPAFIKALQTSTDPSLGEEPVRVVIEKVGVNTVVHNPATRSVIALDELLKSGAVRYPGSGVLASGNMFVFGHSTSLAVVHNQAYKTFNGLGNLVAGDEITVYSTTKKYIYRVKSVRVEQSDLALVDLSTKERMLTLATCNTLGAKEERFVVEADYIRVMPL